MLRVLHVPGMALRVYVCVIAVVLALLILGHLLLAASILRRCFVRTLGGRRR